MLRVSWCGCEGRRLQGYDVGAWASLGDAGMQSSLNQGATESDMVSFLTAYPVEGHHEKSRSLLKKNYLIHPKCSPGAVMILHPSELPVYLHLA